MKKRSVSRGPGRRGRSSRIEDMVKVPTTARSRTSDRRKLPETAIDAGSISARDLVRARLAAIGKKDWWVVRRAGGSATATYRFLLGQSEIRSSGLMEMFAALGLKIVPDPDFDPDQVPEKKGR